MAQIWTHIHIANGNKCTTQPIVLFNVEQLAEIALNLLAKLVLSESHSTKIQSESRHQRTNRQVITLQTHPADQAFGRRNHQIRFSFRFPGKNIGYVHQHNWRFNGL
jgi:hypothetical protein